MGDEDKQFDATPQKLDRARREGQVVKSRDFSMAISMLVVFASVFGLAPFIWEQIVTVFTLLYEQIPNAHLEDINYMYIFLVSVKGILLILFPIFAIAWLVAVLADFVQVGPLVAIAPLMICQVLNVRATSGGYIYNSGQIHEVEVVGIVVCEKTMSNKSRIH